MDLRSGTPYWTTTCAAPGVAATGLQWPPDDETCDVLVVGSGITGAMVVHEVAGVGKRVIVVDRRVIASGSTPASTALVQYEIDTPLVELSEKLGKSRAERAYLAAYVAIENIAGLARSLGVECELAARQSLHLATREEDAEKLENECAARQEIGIPVRFLARVELKRRFGIDRPGALLSELGLELNPLKLTYGLLERASRLGVRIYDRTTADLGLCAKSGGPCVVTTDTGRTIRAEWVVIAAGYETPEQFGEIAKLTQLKSTYAASAPAPTVPWPERALLWELGDPYLYARCAENRVIFGGEDEDFADAEARDALIGKKTRVLARKLEELVPGLCVKPDFAWAGTFAETEDGLPFIGPHRKWPRVLFALGYGGNGITFSRIAAEVLRDMVLGVENAKAGLFSMDRSRNVPSCG